MTIAEIYALVATALTNVFAGSKFKVWANAPDQTALPAVWQTPGPTNTGAGRNAGGIVTVSIVAALAPQTAVAELAAYADAHDRLDTITSAMLGSSPISDHSGVLGPVDIGGVTYTALLYDLTVARSLPC